MREMLIELVRDLDMLRVKVIAMVGMPPDEDEDEDEDEEYTDTLSPREAFLTAMLIVANVLVWSTYFGRQYP